MLEQIQGTFVPDEWHSEHGYEALLDFEMSWVLRLCSKNTQELLKKNGNENANDDELYHQCRIILKKLTGINESVEIDDVKVWRQWNSIDVIAEIYVNNNLHVLVLEDKAYTKMSWNQKDDYPERVFKHYSNEYLGRVVHYHFCVITFFEKREQGYQNLVDFVKEKSFGPRNQYKWKVFSATGLLDWKAKALPKSELFNEFWFAKW